MSIIKESRHTINGHKKSGTLEIDTKTISEENKIRKDREGFFRRTNCGTWS